MIIEENGHSIEVELPVLLCLESMGAIYQCSDPDCCNRHHLTPGITWEDIDLALAILRLEEQ